MFILPGIWKFERSDLIGINAMMDLNSNWFTNNDDFDNFTLRPTQGMYAVSYNGN